MLLNPEAVFAFAIQQRDFSLAHEILQEGGTTNIDILDQISSQDVLLRILEDCHNVDFMNEILNYWDTSSLEKHFPGDGFTPLAVACSTGNMTAVRLLLERGVDPNQRNADLDGTPLLCACASDLASLELVQYLLDAGSQVDEGGRYNTTALHMAVLYGRTDIAKLLLAYGADPNVPEERYGKSPLLMAVLDYQNFDIAKLLLEAFADANAVTFRGWTCLMDLYYDPFKYRDPVKWALLLLEHEADPNYFPKDCDRQQSPIFFYILNREPSETQLDMIELLLENGVDPDTEVCFGMTPLVAACVQNNFELAELLLVHGANVNWRKEALAPTALSAAIQHNHVAMARFLLENGANPNLQYDSEGKTLLQMAFEGRDVVIIRLLLEFNAKFSDGFDVWETTKPGDAHATFRCIISPWEQPIPSRHNLM